MLEQLRTERKLLIKNKNMKKLIITFLTILLFVNKINAQLFEKQEFYSNVKTIKGKYYNGSGGGGYWSIAKLDTLGRTIKNESYRKKKLLARNSFIYNFNNDKLYYIVTFDINNPNRIDTIFHYEYKYQNNRIVYQKNIRSNFHDSTVIQLIENKGDTILIYQEKSYYFQLKTNTTDIFERRHILKYRNDLLVHLEEFDISRNIKKNTHFEYYPNGRLKHRKIEREPAPEFKSTYMGVLGSDDMSYKYKFDKSGRIQRLYYIIGKKKYKIAAYKYNKKN
jgi:hypothetical protein